MLPIQSLQRHDGSVNTLLLYGDFLFSGSEDKEIKVEKLLYLQVLEQTDWSIQYRPKSDVAECSICSGSPFASDIAILG